MPAGIENPVLGYVAFVGVKVAGYALAARWISRSYGRTELNPWKVGVVRTLMRLTSDDDVLHVYVSGSNLALRMENAQMLKRNLRGNTCGKGVTDAQARMSAVGESIERSIGLGRGKCRSGGEQGNPGCKHVTQFHSTSSPRWKCQHVAGGAHLQGGTGHPRAISTAGSADRR